MNREDLKKILPHREPMLLVDEAYVDEDGKAIGIYNVRGDEFFLQGHFPGNPIVPGVIQCEIMAQASCALFEKELGEGKLPVYAGLNNIKFKNQIKPGDQMRIEAEKVREMGPLYCMKGKITVDGKLCMSGEFSVVVTAAN